MTKKDDFEDNDVLIDGFGFYQYDHFFNFNLHLKIFSNYGVVDIEC